MSSLRFIPPGGALVEVTTRTQHGRFLLRPHPDLNEIVRGILARAQRLYLTQDGIDSEDGSGGDADSGVCAFCFLSNHYHLLLRVRDVQQLASFMRYVNSTLAREVARLYDWHDHVWARRYQAIVVSDEPAAQEARLRYLLSQGVKEGLVAHPAEWPGAQSVRALTESEREPIEGVWFDRTKEFWARRRQEPYERRTFASSELMCLLPLPCWSSLSREERVVRALAMIEEIVGEGRALRGGQSPLGIDRILRQKPHDRPVESKRSPAPRFHAATRAVRKGMHEAYRDFVAAYRRAAHWLRESGTFGKSPFPPGCFPPALPFVGG